MGKAFDYALNTFVVVGTVVLVIYFTFTIAIPIIEWHVPSKVVFD